jgi:CDP-diacylglycerol--glycerol-3-phosphate 3-phosphatidyltransferase
MPIARAVGQWVDPNKLTVFSVVPFAVAAVLIFTGHFHWAGWAILAGGLFDVLDGAVARATNKATQFGAFLDSVMDRISDGLIFSAFVLLFSGGSMILQGLALAGLIAAIVTSYSRARALEFGLSIKIGILDRLSRVTIMVVGLLLSLPELTVIVLAILGSWTVWQRIRFAMANLDQSPIQ